MESLRELFRIGYGPSSSHTMGPRAATARFLSAYPDAPSYQAELYGSLAATGKGHLTDRAIREVCEKHGKKVEILWFPEVFKPFHPNALTMKALGEDSSVLSEQTYYSVGGGKIVEEGETDKGPESVYPKEKCGTMSRLLKYCSDEGMQIWEVALECEGPDIIDYIKEVWMVMQDAIIRGINNEGVLPGGLPHA